MGAGTRRGSAARGLRVTQGADGRPAATPQPSGKLEVTAPTHWSQRVAETSRLQSEMQLRPLLWGGGVTLP